MGDWQQIFTGLAPIPNESVDDRISVLIQNGTGITWTYNDPANTFTGNVLQATEIIFGGAEIATQIELNTGTDDLRIVTPLKLSGSAFAYNLGFTNDKGIKSSVTATHQFTPKESASGGIMFGSNGINFDEAWFWGHKTDGAGFGVNTTSIIVTSGGGAIHTNFPASLRGWYYQFSTGHLSLGATGLFVGSLAAAAAVNIIGLGNTAGTSALQIHNSDLTRFLQVQNNGNYIFNSDNVQFQTLASALLLSLSTAAASAVFNVHAVPNVNNTFDIGSLSARWKDLYLSNAISIKNGTPLADSADIFQMYSADIVAGNATAHIRTELGDVIRLFAVGGWGTPTGTLTRTAFDTTTATLTQVAERLAALISDLKTQQNFLKA